MEVFRYKDLLKWESVRRNSFKKWKGVALPPEVNRLARNGFFYYNVKDEIQCFCCGLQLTCSGDEYPEAVHRKLSRHCPFTNELPVGNVSLAFENKKLLVPHITEPFDFVPLRGASKSSRTVEIRPKAVTDR